MREPVRRLLELGPMPSEDAVTDEALKAYDLEVQALTKPATDEEAAGLVAILPESDDALYGLAWTLLHFIESAPGWPIVSALQPLTPWRKRLWGRCANAGLLPHLAEEHEP